MPNWCSNKITINGPKEELLRFLNEGRKNSGLNSAPSLENAIITKPQKATFCLTDWIPCPEIVRRYDLTNYSAVSNSQTRRLVKVGEKMGINDNTIITQEIFDDMKAVELRQQELYGVVGSIEWNRKFLGTKWDSEMFLTLTNDGLVGEFDTAWSPCTQWVANVSKDFPNLSFNLLFYETGCMFCGEYHAENGLTVVDHTEDLTRENAEQYGCDCFFDEDDN